MLHWTMVSPGRHVSQESGFSERPSEKQASAAQPSRSQCRPCSKHLPQIHAWLGSSHTAPSALSLHPLLPHGFYYFTTDHMPAALPIPDRMVESTSLSDRCYFKCSAQNFLCDLISSPSYDVLLLPVPPYLLPSCRCHLFSGQEFPMTQGHQPPLAMSRVTILSESHVHLLPRAAAKLSTCHC